jgi:hypothetical protein
MVENKLTEQAFKHKTLKEVFEDLTTNFINSDYYSYSPNLEGDINFFELKKAIWLASILANSNEELHQERAQRFASLLFLTTDKTDNNYSEIIRICYVLFSRLGNLTGTKFFEGLYKNWNTNEKFNPINFESKYEFGDLLSLELLYQRQDKIISTSVRNYLVTEFQKNLWIGLFENKNIAVSAPTSSGKSFIIKQFLIEKFNTLEVYHALYIVPSRALINQVSEEFRIELSENNVDIKTAYVEEEEE